MRLIPVAVLTVAFGAVVAGCGSEEASANTDELPTAPLPDKSGEEPQPGTMPEAGAAPVMDDLMEGS